MGYTTICPKCGNLGKYNYEYDSYFCEECDVWFETKCDDIWCEICNNRPEKPSGLWYCEE